MVWKNIHTLGTTGPVAQWTTRLTTNQKIAGSSPARIGNQFVLDNWYLNIILQFIKDK